MATVYLAEDRRLGTRVAIKVLKPDVAATFGAGRFQREISIAARLTHPHLLPLRDSGERSGYLFFVMPFVEGESLRDRIRREKQLSFPDVVRITSDVAAGLDHAHRQGVVHRDIKPENILLQGDDAIVADFGIARAKATTDDARTDSGVVLGTAMYMSPEQALGEKELDARSDIYSLGCVVYEMLVGEPPFAGPNVRTVFARHATEPVPSIRVARPDLSEGVEEVIERALAKAPAARHTSVDAFARELHAAMASPGRGRPRPRPNRWAAIVASGIVVVALGTWGVNFWKEPALGADDWILVADFDGPADEPRLANGTRELATAVIGQSRLLRVVERRALNGVMRRAGIAETTHVDVDLARELAKRSAVRGVLRGSVRRMDATTLEIVLHILRADDGSPIASAVATATQSTIADTVERLSVELRRRLGERRRDLAAVRPLRDVATPSFEAFNKYSDGLDAVLTRGDIATSNRLLREAIAADSAFAGAWSVLGANYITARQNDSARVALTRALAFPGRLTAAQSYRLRGDIAYALDRDVDAAIRWYDLYIAESPNSVSGLSNRAVYLTALGRYEDALPDLRRAATNHPFGAGLIQPTLLNLAALHVVLGDVDAARAVADSLVGPFAEYVELMIGTAESRWTDVEAAARSALAAPGTTGVFRLNAVTSLAGALAASGQHAKADSLLRVSADSARGATARWYERARLLLALGDGWPQKRPTVILPADTTLAARVLRAMWSAAAGEATAPTLAERETAVRDAANFRATGGASALVEGIAAARDGRWTVALGLIGPIARVGEHDPTFLDRPDSYLYRWVAGRAYEAAGFPDSALVMYEAMSRPTHLPPGHLSLRGLTALPLARRMAVLRTASPAR